MKASPHTICASFFQRWITAITVTLSILEIVEVVTSKPVLADYLVLNCECKMLTAKMLGSKPQQCQGNMYLIIDPDNNLASLPIKGDFEADKRQHDRTAWVQLALQNQKQRDAPTMEEFQNNNTEQQIAWKYSLPPPIFSWRSYAYSRHSKNLTVIGGSGRIMDTIDYWSCIEE